MFQSLINLALVIGAVFSTGPEQVPTSLCFDPLLGPSMLIYSDCSQPAQKSGDETVEAVDTVEIVEIVEAVETVEIAEIVETVETVETVEPEEPEETIKVKHPNKGGGNGAEGADPGNHPELGNNDEN